MPNVSVGLLKVNKNMFGQDSSNRMAEFGLAVAQANSVLKTQQASHGGGVRMLVAPEYYWSGFGQIGQHYKQHGPVAMDRDDKHTIYAGLKRISSNAGSLVLVAGSIFYQKPNGTRSAAYNVCPVLRSGRFLLKAYKEFDDGASGKNSKTFDYDSKDSDPYFRVDRIGFGIEVCGDHNDQGGGVGGKLKRWHTQTGGAVDIQLLVSDSMTVLGQCVVARNGGYVVQCDIGGTTAGIAVYPAGGPYALTSALPPTAVSGTQVNGAILICYNLNRVARGTACGRAAMPRLCRMV